MQYLDLYILFYLIIFLVIFLLDYFLLLKPKYEIYNGIKKAKKKKKIEVMEVEYLVMKFKLNKSKLYSRWVMLWIAFINAVIITIVSVTVSLIPVEMIFQFLIGFVVLFGLIYSLYELFGRYLIKKGLD